MIFARDKSQMCNNLLQYAHVYAWGREHGRKVISMRFSYKYKYFKISHSSYTGFAWYLMAKYLAALKILPTASFKREDCDKDALEQMMLRTKHIVVSGWYVRFYDLFLKYRDEICDLFTINPEYTEPVTSRMGERKEDIVRLGVHIRRGDYDKWMGGRYYFSDEVYAKYIRHFASLFPDKKVEVYLSTNDMGVDEKSVQELCGIESIYNYRGTPPEDLFMLSECDYLIGPPSTFSLVAIMYRDIPLLQMDEDEPSPFALTDFRLFDYWFRRIK